MLWNDKGEFVKLKKINKIQSLFNNNITVMKAFELREIGFSSRNIKEMVAAGMLERIKHGYYLLSEKAHEISDILIAVKLIPQGVVCLFTAIEYYELSTVNPSFVCIALPRSVNVPTLPQSGYIKIYRMADKHFKLGISETELNGAKLRIYDIEKVVCDCFKYDKEIEKSIALEVLKNYISKGNCNIQKLLEYAKIMGKKKVMLPYVEAML